MVDISLEDAELIFKAGIDTGHLRWENSGLENMSKEKAREGARNVLTEDYTEVKMKGYVGVLIKCGMQNEARNLEQTYNELRDFAGFSPVELNP
tara:strand:+ start:8334 stop:8615 length:282 start_codon:yes stop_codon:yes gene_type:complete